MERLKIVLTDCDTVCASDLDLSVLEKFGDVTYYGETLPHEAAERISDADIIIINKTLIGKAELDAAKRLKLVCLFATGYNNVDVAYARSLGIDVCNAGVYSTSAVAQHVFAFILDHASAVSAYNSDVKNGEWVRSRLFCFFSKPTEELAGKTIGIFGYGAIGHRVAALAKAFEMRVLACTRTPQVDPDVLFVDFDTLLRESDYLSVHCPLNASTAEIFNSEAFAKCKQGLYFVNTSRGGVVNEQDLLSALESGRLSGAAIDVLTSEPMRADCVLRDAPNLTVTPHIAWAPLETRLRLLSIVVGNIDSYLSGKPINLVN